MRGVQAHTSVQFAYFGRQSNRGSDFIGRFDFQRRCGQRICCDKVQLQLNFFFCLFLSIHILVDLWSII